MYKKGFSLGFLVVLIMLVSILLTQVVSTTVAYVNQKEALIENSLEMNRINAEKLAITTDNILRTLAETLAFTAKYLAEDFDSDRRQVLLELTRQGNNSFNSVFVADSEGVVISTAPDNLGISGSKISSVGFMQAIEEKKALISEPYVGKTGRLIIMVSHPVFNEEGTYLGFVGGTVYLHEENVFATMLGTLPYSESGSYVYVVTDKGNLLYHPLSERIGENVMTNEVVQKVVQGKSGEQRVINTKGVDMLTGYFPVNQAGWGVVSQTPVSAAISASNQILHKIIRYSLPLIIIIVILIYGLIRYISMPLHKLALITGEVSNYNQSLRPIQPEHRWNYETNQLYHSISLAYGRIQDHIQELSDVAHTDPLTGLYNRRHMEKVLADWQHAETEYCFLIIDIDYFKAVNDTYGHHTGDEVLQFLAEILENESGENDVCCRYGGEEFTVLSPQPDLASGLQLAEKIRTQVEKLISPTGKSITISIGLAHSADGQHLQSVKEAADAALYRAKENGRNRSEGPQVA